MTHSPVEVSERGLGFLYGRDARRSLALAVISDHCCPVRIKGASCFALAMIEPFLAPDTVEGPSKALKMFLAKTIPITGGG